MWPVSGARGAVIAVGGIVEQIVSGIDMVHGLEQRGLVVKTLLAEEGCHVGGQSLLTFEGNSACGYLP